MQELSAALLGPVPGATEVRAERLTGGGRPRLSAAPAAVAVRPGLLDTRLVRAELSRLRDPGRRMATRAGRRSA